MYLKRIKTFGVKVFSRAPAEIIFNRGLNVIYGLNRSGKSSLIDAIFVGIFGFLKGNRLNKGSLKSWSKSEEFYIDLDVEIDSEIYKYYRNFNDKIEIIKKFENKHWNIITEKAGEIDNFNRENLGIENPEFFLSTVFIRQKDLSKIGENIRSVGNIIQKLFSGSADIDIGNVIRELEKERDDIKLASGRDDKRARKREYTLLNQKFDELKEEHSRYLDISKEIDEKSGIVKKLKTEIPELEKEFNELQILTDKVKKAGEHKDKIKDLTEKHVSIESKKRRFNDLKTENEEIEKKLKNYLELDLFEDEVENIDRWDENKKIKNEAVNEKENELDEIKNELRKLDEEKEKYQAFEKFEDTIEKDIAEYEVKASEYKIQIELLNENIKNKNNEYDRIKKSCKKYNILIFSVIPLTLIVFFIWWLTKIAAVFAFGTAALAVSIVLFLLFLKNRISINSMNKEINRLNEDLKILNNNNNSLEDFKNKLFTEINCNDFDELRKKYEDYKDIKSKHINKTAELNKVKDKLEMEKAEFEDIDSRMKNLFEKTGSGNFIELKNKIEDYRDLRSKLDKNKTAYAEQLEGKDEDFWNDEQMKIQSKIRILENTLSEEGLEDFKPSNQEINAWQVKMTEMSSSIKEKNDLLKRSEGELKHLQRDFETPEDVELELQEVEKSLKELDNKFYAYTIAIDTLNEVGKEVESDYKPHLEEQTKKILMKLVREDYKGVFLDLEKKGQVLLDADDKKNVTEEELSLGTLDQLYFALRLASIQVIEKGKYPLIIDDSFTNYDTISESAVLDIIEDISRERQVLFLTCHSRFLDWAKNSVKKLRENISIFEIDEDHKILQR